MLKPFIIVNKFLSKITLIYFSLVFSVFMIQAISYQHSPVSIKFLINNYQGRMYLAFH